MGNTETRQQNPSESRVKTFFRNVQASFDTNNQQTDSETSPVPNGNVTIYIIKCHQGKYYVGKSRNYEQRIVAHFEGSGSEWTKLHKPIEIIETHPNCDDYDEDKYVIKTMKEHGIDNVRGGTFSQINLDDACQSILRKMIYGSSDKCFSCGSDTHFIAHCPNRNIENSDSLMEKNNNCFRCGREGHFKKDCYAKKHIDGRVITLPGIQSEKSSQEISVESNDSKNKPKRVIKCHKCGKFGHYASICYA